MNKEQELKNIVKERYSKIAEQGKVEKCFFMLAVLLPHRIKSN